MSALVRSFALALPLLAGLGLAWPVAAAQAQTAAIREVPSQHEAGGLVINYRRLRPQIATGGLIQPGAVPKLKELGFATIVDLRGPMEGTAVEKQAAQAAGIRYFNIPVTEGLPSDAQLAEFGRVIQDPKNYPVLVHCASANRVGATWALYRIHSGIPVEMALAEGQAIGMRAERQPTFANAYRRRRSLTDTQRLTGEPGAYSQTLRAGGKDAPE
jgi:uncharacterized protein (TIGR01244 family)